jgi:hypothetical protein
MNVQYFDFGRYHGKREMQGSTYIRMKQMQKYWPELSPYTYGANPDALIFQKVYITPDYEFPKYFEGIKILDICDPDWMEDQSIVETSRYMDAITCPTEALADFIRQFHSNVVVIPDRWDVTNLPKPKVHNGKAKTVVWFGYPHNAELLKPAMQKLDELDLNLILISGDDPLIHRWGKRDYKKYYKYTKHPVGDDLYALLQKADFALLPEGNRPQDRFKSNNKTTRANLAGLPVARTAEDVDLYMKPENRRKWFDKNYDNIKKQYDIRRSVAEYQELINAIKAKRN